METTIIQEKTGCKISGNFTEEELEKLKKKGWEVMKTAKEKN